MAKNKVDLDKDYGLVYGHDSGAKYEQDGKLFDGLGDYIGLSNSEGANEKTNPEANPELDALKVKAKELGIKSPHLFKQEALALKVEEAELAALSAGKVD